MVQDAMLSNYEFQQVVKCVHDGWLNEVDDDLIEYFELFIFSVMMGGAQGSVLKHDVLHNNLPPD